MNDHDRDKRIRMILDEIRDLDLDLSYEARCLVRQHIEQRDYSLTIQRMIELTAQKALGISHTQVHRLVRGGALPAFAWVAGCLSPATPWPPTLRLCRSTSPATCKRRSDETAVRS